MGDREIEDSLDRLDKLTQDEAQIASAEQLRLTHDVSNRVGGVEGQVQDVGNTVQVVDDKLDQVKCSLSP